LAINEQGRIKNAWGQGLFKEGAANLIQHVFILLLDVIPDCQEIL